MELHTLDRQRAMANSHHLAVLGSRRHVELVGDMDCGERVVAPDLDRARKPCEDALPVVLDPARLAVDELTRLRDLAAEGLDDRLVPEADAERRRRGAELADELERAARVERPAGPGRDDQAVGVEVARVCDA